MTKNFWYIFLTFILGLIILVIVNLPDDPYLHKSIIEIRHTPKNSKLTDIQDVNSTDTIKIIFEDSTCLTIVDGEKK